MKIRDLFDTLKKRKRKQDDAAGSSGSKAAGDPNSGVSAYNKNPDDTYRVLDEVFETPEDERKRKKKGKRWG